MMLSFAVIVLFCSAIVHLSLQEPFSERRRILPRYLDPHSWSSSVALSISFREGKEL